MKVLFLVYFVSLNVAAEGAHGAEAGNLNRDPSSSTKLYREIGENLNQPLNISAENGKRNFSVSSESDTDVKVESFHHDGCYWEAVIPKRGLKEAKVIFQVEEWNGDIPGGHGQVRYQMPEGAKIALMNPSGSEECERRAESYTEMDDFIVSAEAWHVDGENYDPLVAGMLGEYEIVYRMLSLDYVKKKADESEGIKETRQWAVDFSDSEDSPWSSWQRARAKAEAVDANLHAQKYNTLRKNCISEGLEMIGAPLPQAEETLDRVGKLILPTVSIPHTITSAGLGLEVEQSFGQKPEPQVEEGATSDSGIPNLSFDMIGS